MKTVFYVMCTFEISNYLYFLSTSCCAVLSHESLKMNLLHPIEYLSHLQMVSCSPFHLKPKYYSAVLLEYFEFWKKAIKIAKSSKL